MSHDFCVNDEIDIKSEPFEEHDTEFDSNETFEQNVNLSVNEIDTDNIEIGVEDVKPFEIIEVETESLLAEPVTDNSLTCGKCNATFTSHSSLGDHQLNHLPQSSILKDAADKIVQNKEPAIIDQKEHKFCQKCNAQLSSRKNRKQHFCAIQDNVKIETFEEHDAEFDSNETFGQNTTLSGNEMDTGNIEIGVEDVKPFEFVEVKTESLLAEPVTDNSRTCGKSNSIFKRQSSLNSHLVSSPVIKPYTCRPCSLCSSKFVQRTHLKEHLLTLHKLNENSVNRLLRLHKCETCHLIFKTKQNLTSHIDSAHKELRPFKCNVCTAGYTRKNRLDSHLLTHFVKKICKCFICHQDLRTKGCLQNHLIKVHGKTKIIQNKQATLPVKALMVCKKCNVQFSSYENVSQHVCTIQDNVKIETFEEHDTEFDSNETFGQNTTLSGNEMDTDNIEIGEEDVKPFEIVEVKTESLLAEPVTDNSYTCGECSEEFSSHENLQKHLLNFHDIGTKCSTCNVTFDCQSSLNSHLPFHDEQSTFTCEVCSSKFTLKNDLKKHLLRTHRLDETSVAGFMPPPVAHVIQSNICETCQRTFSAKDSLKKHLTLQHSNAGSIFECTVCHFIFSKKGNLKRHIKSIHKELNRLIVMNLEPISHQRLVEIHI